MAKEPHANSYYAASANPAPDRPELNDDIEVDVNFNGPIQYSGTHATWGGR